MELHHGDCLEVMKTLPANSVDMVCCDMPYGTTQCKWDSVIDLAALWREYDRVCKENAAIVLFAQTPFDKILGCSNIKSLKYEIIWEKTAATGHLNAKKMVMKAHENLLVFYRKLPVYNPQKTQNHSPVNSYSKQPNSDGECYGKTGVSSGGGNTDRYPRSVIKFSSDKQTCRLHPTQKPVALLEWLIKTYSNPGDLVLDNCMGSGSTGVAAAKTGRRFYGIELDGVIFTTATKRLAPYSGA